MKKENLCLLNVGKYSIYINISIIKPDSIEKNINKKNNVSFKKY